MNGTALLIASAGAGMLLALAGCERETGTDGLEAERKAEVIEHIEQHLDPDYVCPMHPDVVFDEPGNCPICGMYLVARSRDTETADGGRRRLLFYRHPHDPAIVSREPMQDQMGMDYVPVYDDGDASAVRIDPAVVHNLGVRTAIVERGTLWKRIDTVAYVGYDESRTWHVHTRADGWIEKLAVRSVGDRVAAGALLFELYSPTLASAQEEYLQALSMGGRNLIRASEGRLRALGLRPVTIRELGRTRKPDARISFVAEADAVVTHLDVREGMFVTPETIIVSLADLASVWVIAEVFERQASWVAVGHTAEMQLGARPGEVWNGEVEFIYPDLDPVTRTLRVRMRFANPGELLMPNMFASVTIFGGPAAEVVHIPREALIRTGRSERVILSLGGGRFRASEVVSGLESGERVAIAAGLEPGEAIVVSGQFLIDSEASMKASLERLRGNDDAEPGRDAGSSQ